MLTGALTIVAHSCCNPVAAVAAAVATQHTASPSMAIEKNHSIGIFQRIFPNGLTEFSLPAVQDNEKSRYLKNL